LYLKAAELVQSEELAEAATVATGNAVLAAIAAADAICCAAAGVRCRGQDHRQAIALLQEVTADAGLARALRDVLDLKDAGHYGLSNVSSENCLTALRRARALLDGGPGDGPRGGVGDKIGHGGAPVVQVTVGGPSSTGVPLSLAPPRDLGRVAVPAPITQRDAQAATEGSHVNK
jgi:hypothetical protein